MIAISIESEGRSVIQDLDWINDKAQTGVGIFPGLFTHTTASQEICKKKEGERENPQSPSGKRGPGGS
jgi:hypothetical protein